MTDQDMLAAAQAARHKLLLGANAVEVIHDGYSVKFTTANREALDAYIAELEARIAGLPRRGAIGLVL